MYGVHVRAVTLYGPFGSPIVLVPVRLARLDHAQVCLISGESGAGKTETAKYFVNNLLHFAGTSNPMLERQIIESGPLLEAFGNAQTGLNDNSSRFGKYLEIHFDDGNIIGATMRRYLLEKTRVTHQAPNEVWSISMVTQSKHCRCGSLE